MTAGSTGSAPTESWTFDDALSALAAPPDQYLSANVDQFLLANKSVVFQPDPFYDDKPNPPKETKSVSVRGVTYTHGNCGDAGIVSRKLQVQFDEVYRIISQTNLTIPERQVKPDEFKSKLPDDRAKLLIDERVTFYCARVLRQRRTVLQVAIELLRQRSSATQSVTVQNLGREIYISTKYVDGIIDALNRTVGLIVDPPAVGADIEEVFHVEAIMFAVELLKLLFEVLLQNPTITAATTRRWFTEFCARHNYLINVGPGIAAKHQEQFDVLKGLCSLCSIMFLDLETSFDSEGPKGDSYYADDSSLVAINEVITKQSNTIDTPMVSYCWMVLLLRKYYFLEDHPRDFPFDLKSTITALEAPVDRVYSEITTLSRLFEFDNTYSVVLVEVLAAILPLVAVTPELCNVVAEVVRQAPPSIIEKFFGSESVQGAVVVARTKFPHQIAPFVDLARVNGQLAAAEFGELRSYMASFLKSDFERWYTIDDENTELVRLTQSVEIYPPMEAAKKVALMLEPGTRAKVLPSDEPHMVLAAFLYRYSGWAFLGRIMYNQAKYADSPAAAVGALRLVNQVLTDGTDNDIATMLADLGAYVDDGDFFAVVLRFLDQGMHGRQLEVAEAAVDFMRLALPYLDHRVWAYLAQSQLCGHHGFAPSLYGAVEMVRGDYPFTRALVRLTDALVAQALVWTSKPHPAMGHVLAHLTRHLVYVFESFGHCQFNHAFEKLEMGILVSQTFSHIVSAATGVVSSSITSVLSEPASVVTAAFAEIGAPRAVAPIAAMIEAAATNSYEIWDVSGYVHINWIQRCLALCRLLLDANIAPSDQEESTATQKKSGAQLVVEKSSSQALVPVTAAGALVKKSEKSSDTKEPTESSTVSKDHSGNTPLAQILFSHLPQLVTLYNQHPYAKQTVLEVMTAMIRAPSAPSLLVYLGQHSSEVFINTIVDDLTNSLTSTSVKSAIYDFVCGVMSSTPQSGMAVLLVSAEPVFPGTPARPQSVLSILKANAIAGGVPDDVRYRLLDAIALSFTSWGAAADDAAFVRHLVDTLSSVDIANSLRVGAKVAEILALYLFCQRGSTEARTVISAAEKLPLESLFAVSGYRPEVYTAAEEALAFTGYSLPGLITRVPGSTDVYNIDLLSSLFAQTEQWPALSEAVASAASNISHVEDQAELARSAGALVVALAKDESSPRMISLAASLLQLNDEEGVPAPLFEQVFNQRIQVAFFLVYQAFRRTPAGSAPSAAAAGLASSKDSKQVARSNAVEPSCALNILKSALSLLESAPGVNFLSVLSTQPTQGNYRPLLRIIYCCLNMVAEDGALILEQFSVFRTVFDLVVGKATRTILAEFQHRVHTKQNADSLVDDLWMVLAILQAFLSLRFVDPGRVHGELANVVDENGTVSALLGLYRRAHAVEVNSEFVFARIALQFIQELMQISEVVADKFVQAGLFIVLVESPMSKPLRAGGVTITSAAPYHRLWTSGILPLFSTTLGKIGPAAAEEVAMGLQLFGKQVASCFALWGNDSSSIKISTAAISETGQLLLLFEILRLMLHPSNAATTNATDIDMPMFSGYETRAKRDKFTNCLTNLLKHPKFLATRIVPSSVDEKRVMENGGPTYDSFVKQVIADISDLKDFE
ncbi:nucleoporin Nup188p [Diutina catenulata]